MYKMQADARISIQVTCSVQKNNQPTLACTATLRLKCLPGDGVECGFNVGFDMVANVAAHTV